jgi:hypothetical protein
MSLGDTARLESPRHAGADNRSCAVQQRFETREYQLAFERRLAGKQLHHQLPLIPGVLPTN